MIVIFRIFWNSQNSAQFINEATPVLRLGNLAEYLRTEIVNHRPSIQYADGDIKSIKSSSGINAACSSPSLR
ncbi:hypothetical protein ACHAWF_013443 [Thalassiosira exigua]